MILTVCLNPCTDVTIEVDSLNVGKINHVKSKTLSFTGAALNVAIGVARLHGKSYATGFMYNENGSLFEDYRKDGNNRFIASAALQKLVRETKARYVLLSYSSGGRISREELYDILNAEGTMLKSLEIDSRTNVMGQMRLTNKWVNTGKRTSEYLFLLEK